MIRRIQLLRNIGQFDSVTTGATIDLRQLVLIYAENSRGKTTLAAIFRSLATGNPIPIIERHRLASQHQPHVVLACDGGPPDAMFQNGTWNRSLPQLALFDDVFIDENIHSGLAVDTRHRQNLHELVLGARGVTLSQRLQDLVVKIEQHNRALREKSSAIPERERQGFSADDFCNLPELQDIDVEIEATERALAAAREQDAVRNTPLFDAYSLPSFDTQAIEEILTRAIPDLDAAAEARVRAHVEALGVDGEQWISDGMQRLKPSIDQGPCPFCAQDLSGSNLIEHYRAYFSEAYEDLKRSVTEMLTTVRREHGGDVPAAFERAVRVTGERRHFWSRFSEVPDLSIDTAAIVRDWNAARDGVVAVLLTKQSTPLESLEITQEVRDAIAVHEEHKKQIEDLSDALTSCNEALQIVQEQAAGANPITIATDLTRLHATKSRHAPEIAHLCNEYLMEREAKSRTEVERTTARDELDEYRTNVFPASQTAINVYLRRFNAGFRLESISSISTRGGDACIYNVMINETPVTIAGGDPREGEPSFRNTLSSGDRNTLALAFFFASLYQDPDLGNKIVIIDDPISSLDDHRSLTTVQEIRRLAERADQVVLLSHNKRFLCRVWNGTDPTIRVAMEIARENEGSTIRVWNVDDDSITEHDRRHTRLCSFVASSEGDPREVAQSIRPHLEAFLRVAQPERFPPGTLLGPFLNVCRQRLHQADEILGEHLTNELAELVDYANRFHHDTNPAWETELINNTELRGFVERTLSFCRI
ncbi:AAA family ATPase [Calditrichota bacterium]